MSEEERPSIKVTDRRMFTETGELREDWDEPDDSGEESPRPSQTPRSVETPGQGPAAPPKGGAAEAPGGTDVSGGAAPGGEASEAPPGYGSSARSPEFLDLVGMLAEPAALFLGDASMPGQEPMEDLPRARMHIDLLALLEDKCKGNLTEQESAVLTDLVYRLRMRYVEKKKG